LVSFGSKSRVGNRDLPFSPEVRTGLSCEALSVIFKNMNIHFPPVNVRIPVAILSLLLLCIDSLSQVPEVKLSLGQLIRFRKGYIVTIDNDTVYSLICHSSDNEVFFVPEPFKYNRAWGFNKSKIPCLTTEDEKIKSFLRNGLLYEPCKIPPKNKTVFLTVLEAGTLTLYALLNEYSNKSFMGTVSKAEYKSEKGYFMNFDDEYYGIKDFYLRKNTDQLILIPRGDNKFQKVFLPLIRDNKTFVRSLSGQDVDYSHIRSLVKQYNSTLGK